MTNGVRRKRRLRQKGVQAIFTEERESGRAVNIPVIIGLVFLLTLASFSAVAMNFHVEMGSGSRGTDHGGDMTGGNRSDASLVYDAKPPEFFAISNGAESMVTRGNPYRTTSQVNLGDFIVVQVSYSSGSQGNLPDIYNVNDSQSNTYQKQASVSLGVGTNFWEQAWTARASSKSTPITVIVSLDWTDCQEVCVTSIIMTVVVARYTNVAGVGALAIAVSNTYSTFQTVNLTTTQVNSTIIELLSHGAANNCILDPPQPRSGQTSRNCSTSTTERTEFFDHTTRALGPYNESYFWVRSEVQRGIYLELKGNIFSRIITS